MMMGMMMMTIPFLVIGGVLCLPFVFRWLPAERRDDIPVPKRKRQVSAPSNALEVLEGRYARGELSRGEYLEIREDLRG